MLKEKELSGFFLVLATAFISGFSIFINKFGVKGISSSVFTGAKNALVALSLFFLIIASGKLEAFKRLNFKNWVTLFLIGLFGGSLPFLLFFKGLSLTGAAQASFVHKNMFLMVALLAMIFLKESIDNRFLLASLLLLGGNVFLFRLFSLSFNWGDLMILLATFLWAVENIISKRALKDLCPQIVAFGRMFFGSLLIFFFLFGTGEIYLISQLNFHQLSWIFLTSFFLLGYVLTWYKGLRSVRVSLASTLLTLGSPITTILSFNLGTGLAGSQMIGIMLLFSGVLFIGSTEIIKYPLKFLHDRT